MRLIFQRRLFRGLPVAIIAAAVIALEILSPSMTQAASGSGSVNHYVTDDNSVGFVLDLSGETPLMLMDDSLEIVALTEVLGPRGDVIYKYSSGREVLRRTNIGGMTLFDRFYPEGRPVVLTGQASRITLTPIDLKTAKARASLLALNISERIGSQIVFDTDWASIPGGEQGMAVLADAMQIVTIGLRRVSVDPLGQEALVAGFDRVVFVPDSVPSIKLEGQVLRVGYAWQAGVEGRPTSTDLVTYLEDTL